jgi:hypothetical protein
MPPYLTTHAHHAGGQSIALLACSSCTGYARLEPLDDAANNLGLAAGSAASIVLRFE